ncbi:MAG: ABC transporter substrate-binding protein [Usitatibacter sp.]
MQHLPVNLWDEHDIETKIAAALARHPAVIIASNSENAAIAKRVAKNVPVVFVSRQDPIGLGLVESLAHPGGHLTGFTYFSPIDQKRLEFLREIVPHARRLGIVVDRWWMKEFGGKEILEQARLRQSFEPTLFRAESIAELRRELAGKLAGTMEAWYVPYTALPFDEPDLTLEALESLHKPVVFPATLFAERGALLSYQEEVRLDEMFQVVATMIGLILDGVPPGDIPVERPKAFELAINVTAARGLGVVIPEALIKRADRVIVDMPGPHSQ